MDNKHYEFTAAVSLLIDPESDSGKSILESSNEFYMGLQDELNNLSSGLSESLKISLSDGMIDIDEAAEVANLQQQIADIIQKVSESELSAQMDLIQLKFGGGTIDSDSFENLMSQMKDTIEEWMSDSDEAFVVSVSGLKLQLDEGAISQSEYNSQVSALAEQYGTTIDSLKAKVEGIELDIIDDAYGDILGEDAKQKMSNAISESLAAGIQPKNWSLEEVRQFLGADDLSAEVAGAMSDMLGSVAEQMQSMTIDTSAFTEKLQSALPDVIDINQKLNLNAETIVNPVDTTNLASDFGISDSTEKIVELDLEGLKKVGPVKLDVEEFGIPDYLNKTVKINITGVPNYVGNFSGVGKYRGGIVGGSTALQGFARGGITGYPNGGMVRGGAQLITVAEEGNPEMIIPLSSQRRERALKLWAQAGHMMDVPGFFRGGTTSGGSDEGMRFDSYGSDNTASGQSVVVDVGGINVQITVEAGSNGDVAEAIRAQSGEIAETVAGILADAFGAQFENTPTRGGVA